MSHESQTGVVRPSASPVAVPDYVSAWRVARYVRRLNRLRRRGDREAVLAEQRINTQRLLRFALERCGHYRDRFRGDAASPRLADFEPTSKTALMSDFSRVVTDAHLRLDDLRRFVEDPARVGEVYRGLYVAAHTSGSSGERGVFVIDQFGWELGQALAICGTEIPNFRWGWPRALISPLWPLSAATVIPTGGHFASVLMPRIRSTWTDRIVRMREIEISEPFDEIVAKINAMRPFALHSYPTMLAELANARLDGRLKARPWILTSGGEPFTPEIVARVRRAWPGIVIYDIYACTEVLSVARSCSQGRYHVNEDWVVVENVDHRYRPVPAGERGDRVLLTHLFNYLMPIVRYEMSDSVTWDDSACPCGSPLAHMRIEGRTNHTLVLPGRNGGNARLVPLPILVSFLDVPHLRTYQVVQTGPEAIEVRYVPEAGASIAKVEADIDRVLRDHLRRNGADDRHVAVTCVRVEAIERDPRTHKITQVVNLATRGAEDGRGAVRA